jgi:hypothetical protein
MNPQPQEILMLKTVIVIFAVIFAAFFGFGYLSANLMDAVTAQLFGSAINRATSL